MTNSKIQFLSLQKGFSLFEAVIVIAVLTILSAVVIFNFDFIKKQSEVDNSTQEFAGVLRLAQSRTIASENSSRYGVYINTAVSPNQYMLFKGNSYASRDIASDQIYFLPRTVKFRVINLVKTADGSSANEIVFDRLTGASEESGSVSFEVETNPGGSGSEGSGSEEGSEEPGNPLGLSNIVYISGSGTISFKAPSSPSDSSRLKDSRHVHFDYARVIDTLSEDIVLDFNNGSAVQTIPISQNLVAGKFDWQGSVNVGGSDQVIHIRTHRLNSTDTQFSINRDRRYNNASLKITISGDVSGYLANYSADGTAVGSTSIYVSNLAWQ